MASAAVTPQMRAHAWNIHLVSGRDKDRFGGLYYPPDSSTLTYRDLAREICLCFQFKGSRLASSDSATQTVAFGLVDAPPSRLPEGQAFVCGRSLDSPLSTPPRELSVEARAPEPREPGILRLHVVRHADCHLPSTEPLATHLEARCAIHVHFPSPRLDDRYLPPNKPSSNPAFAIFPYRKTIRASRSSGSRSPPKRTASGSVSPVKDARSHHQDASNSDDMTSLVTPPEADVTFEVARQAMTRFRESCLTGSGVCAVTGKGRSWCNYPPMGPGLQACHIVPQQHYHVYPLPGDLGADHRHSRRRLREAWDRTWSASNAILLLSHLHEAFDARLFSIHPDTMRIRVFVPYDVLAEYHDKIAILSQSVDRKALRHHYEMCCIENMAAEMTLTESGLIPATESRSGIASPLELRPGGLGAPPAVAPDPTHDPSSKPGDPSKRSLPDDPNARGTHPYDHEAGSLSGSEASVSTPSWDGCFLDGSGTKDRRFWKRRKLASGGCVEGIYEHGDLLWEGYITPSNAKSFLADVNWELSKGDCSRD